MKWKNIKLVLLFTTVIVVGAFTNGLAAGNVEWNILKTLQLDATPIDVAITPDGRRIYVLTEQGEILVYSSTQNVEAKIEVGQHVDQLKLGPRGETLILTSGQNKTVQVVSLDFIQKIQEISLAVGLNQEEYEKKKKDPAIERKVRQDLSEGRQAGVRGTPTIFINGRRLKDRSLKGFQAAIDKELQKMSKAATQPSS